MLKVNIYLKRNVSKQYVTVYNFGIITYKIHLYFITKQNEYKKINK